MQVSEVEITVTVRVTLQLLDILYLIVVVPVATPVTMPEDDPTVATDVSVLVHTPPETVSVNVPDLPTQTIVGPFIAGSTYTLTTMVTDVSHSV